MYERFHDRAAQGDAARHQEAQRFNHEYIAHEHILSAGEEGSGVRNVLKNLDIDLEDPSEVERSSSRPATWSPWANCLRPPAQESDRYSIEEARNLNHNYVDEHLLLGLACASGGLAAQVLMNLGSSWKTCVRKVLNLLGTICAGRKRGRRQRTPGDKGKSRPRLDSFGPTSPSSLAGQLDPVIGANEIERVIQVQPPHKNTGAARRGRRRQDRHRRRAGHSWSIATSPSSCATGASSCSTWHDGRRHKFAASSRSASSRHERGAPRQEHHPVHRRLPPGRAGGARGALSTLQRLKRPWPRRIQCIGATPSTSIASTSRRRRASNGASSRFMSIASKG